MTATHSRKIALHSTQCQASALICAVENMRDWVRGAGMSPAHAALPTDAPVFGPDRPNAQREYDSHGGF